MFWSEGRRSERESTGETDEGEAQAYFAQWILDRRNEQSEEAGASAPIADLWALYWARYVEKDVASPATLKYAWQNLAAHFGALTVKQVDQNCVETYEARRAAGAIGRASTSSTVRRELVALRACLNWCADPKRKIIPASALPQFDLPAAGEARDRWLRPAEIDRLLTAAEALRRASREPGRLSRGERFLRIALETAARKEAIFDLTWDRVDFETNVIHLNVPGRKLTKKRRADVPISAALRPVLLRAYEERANDLVLDNKAEIWATVQVIAEKAGLAPARERENGQKPKATGISPHVLRHTAATHMARRGVPLFKIAKVLGNSVVMVEKVYAKHCPDDLRDAVDAISGK
ncbi:tyrosine-type recombinase/integrase [Mangrovibrevibacter kandeliae]|uniref:tyrosine-type recombinase/integrase n=1 Tax=Mangrovibrevibacter kandeliae TaxID=2968473 RepID=UPI0022302A8C|nr:site-specific integrase [Aurantimonas sp. MSK8Z-1]